LFRALLVLQPDFVIMGGGRRRAGGFGAAVSVWVIRCVGSWWLWWQPRAPAPVIFAVVIRGIGCSSW
jgi:hypothetical protein